MRIRFSVTAPHSVELVLNKLVEIGGSFNHKLNPSDPDRVVITYEFGAPPLDGFDEFRSFLNDHNLEFTEESLG